MTKDDKPTAPQTIEKPPADKPNPRIQAPQFDVITEGGAPPDKVKKG